MKGSASAGWKRSSPWLILALLSAVLLAVRLQFSFDLSAFLPSKTTLSQDVLLEQLRNGPGSRLIVIGITGAPMEQLRGISDRLRRDLEAHPAFITVQNGQGSDPEGSIPEPISSHYLLMQDIDYSRESLSRAIQSRLRDLAIGGGANLLELIARDPFLATIDILERLVPGDAGGEVWFAENGAAVLLAATRAPSTDLTRQAAAVTAIRSTFADIDPARQLDLEVTGVGAFGVELQETIRAEAQRLTILAVLALCLVLMLIYRRPRMLVLALVPLGMGALLGLTVVSLVFDSVHGITLAFGFTLLGVAIDYPLHLFSHSRYGGPLAAHSIWHTMRLGAVSTGLAYVALSLAGSEGLAQLGVLTAVGIVTAALVTRYWLPVLLAEGSPNGPAESERGTVLHYVPAAAVLALSLAVGHVSLGEDELWDDRMESLSPVPQRRLQTDTLLRSSAATPDMRYQIVMHDDSLEALLIRGDSVEERLAEARSDGLLQGWQSVSQLLPSRRLQAARRDAIPQGAVLRTRLADALAGSPFRADAFAPFVEAAGRQRELPPLGTSTFKDTRLQPWLDAHLLNVGDRWVSLISVREADSTALADRIGDWGEGIRLVDLRQASHDMMQNYRTGATRTVALAATLIVCLIWLQRRRLSQVLWIVLTVGGALAMTATAVMLLHGQLTVIHLMALLLVLGLVLDYALFLSRQETVSERRATHQAVLACAASTTLAFAVLATSTIPILAFLGATVATGAATGYLLAVSGSRQRTVA